MTQAWSLFFTGGQEENALSDKPERAWFYTNLLIASVVTGIVGTLLFASF